MQDSSDFKIPPHRSRLVKYVASTGGRFPHHMAATRPLRPILPSTPGLLRIRFVTRRARGNFSIRERLEFAELDRCQLDTRIARQVYRKPDDIDQRLGCRCESVTSH